MGLFLRSPFSSAVACDRVGAVHWSPTPPTRPSGRHHANPGSRGMSSERLQRLHDAMQGLVEKGCPVSPWPGFRPEPVFGGSSGRPSTHPDAEGVLIRGSPSPSVPHAFAYGTIVGEIRCEKRRRFSFQFACPPHRHERISRGRSRRASQCRNPRQYRWRRARKGIAGSAPRRDGHGEPPLLGTCSASPGSGRTPSAFNAALNAGTALVISTLSRSTSGGTASHAASTCQS